TASYRYDPFGRRISKTVEGITTEFFWQGDTLIAEHQADRHRSYLYEPDSFRPLALLEGFGPNETKPYHYQLDHLGTPQELTAPDGEIVWSAHYRAYGEITRLDIGKIDNPLRFQGQYVDEESGLHYNRHRYYNPDIGRYLTPDPVKLAGGINPYQYVPNPTGWIDPLGLSTCPGDGCEPNSPTTLPKPSVDEGAPALPQLPRTNRQSRIDALTEANAKRRVLGWEQEYDMHTVEKHGPEIPDSALKQRSIDGTNPTTGERGNISSSSQFNSWKMQLHAINKAMGRMQGASPSPTGFDRAGNPVVVVELPGAGRGYKPNRRDVNNPRYIETMERAEIRFDRNNPTRPFTAFPK
ncbi:RHS repeat domain-containing protein, partial [Pseudomonas simiae]|uniref:RHS repeat domain-containing protein n=1 Tax=Pseudomonas simiae TaxID=321846 RepID=UPI0033152732